MALKAMAVGRRDVFVIPLNKVVSCNNVRDRVDQEHVSRLAQSIGSIGQKQPVVVREVEGGVEIINGEHRYRAILKHNAAAVTPEGSGEVINTIYCIAETRNQGQAERIVDQLTANDGLPLTPLEEAKAYKALEEMGMKTVDIARKTGRDRKYVAGRLDILTMEPELAEAVDKRQVSATAARAVSKAPSDVQRRVAKKKGVTLAEARKEAGTGGRTVVSISGAKKKTEAIIKEIVAEYKDNPVAGMALRDVRHRILTEVLV